ncbi:tRNA (adenosine(37)-N6)-threonylcarbamoyltransferase complex transferase subunit TsaD [Methylophilaceae bacterium]|nr:tRNA (adenosine(37)-N6)-threonylcarbamoyltransferase complex transferase subunit TsaD [Methylophilaceae bacterium]|tara:strand:- start:2017 stop:3033 length:1017 start_codon:yes stop_codon:yes gene_type:complete
MLVLGIESSCDETGIAIYDSKKGLLGHTLHSQIELHSFYGGVVPELAARDHIKYIIPLIDKLLEKNAISIDSIDSIAYTAGPGLSGALLVGSSLAEALAYSLNIPSIPVHHLEGHLLAPMLEDDKPSFPFLALLVSGGHTQLIDVKEIGKYEILGDTLDDAAGEAFDKTAKLLGLGYPGGAVLSKLADKGKPEFELPRPLLNTHGLNFSFSGLKTAVLTLVKKQIELTDSIKANIAFAFQESITDVLVKKSIKALKQTGYKNIVVSGGVGANKQLREKLKLQSKNENFKAFFPKLEFCTDNGAMIALAGALRAHLSSKNNYKFSVKPRWKLSEIESTF